MAPHGDGDGWVACACGRRHWGRFGAAGLLLAAQGKILLQHRASWSHEGGTWGVPGGARNRPESALAAALREAVEETGLDVTLVRPSAELLVDHGTWSYTTVVASAAEALAVSPQDAESEELRWVARADVVRLALHPGFAASWPLLSDAIGLRLTLVIDGANVVGSRPDGWWRDRAGAASRLRAALASLSSAPLPDSALPAELPRPRLSAWYAEPVLVVEGAARALAEPELAQAQPARPERAVRVVPAAGSGDDALVRVV
ncbi:MAG: NUDIX domain-containing protein, partial [Actinomycetota bacterium]|nr:NUDIX domain-containing protein [Actinomycetota bacterium]